MTRHIPHFKEETSLCRQSSDQSRLWASLTAQLVKILVQFLGWEDPLEKVGYPLQYSCASLVAQLVKNLPAMWETWVQSLGWDDPPEKGKATHSSILVWRISWTA